MSSLRILDLDQYDEWTRIVRQSFQHDFYHLPGYHALDDIEGVPRLFVYSEDDRFIALPLLLRPVDEVLGISYVGDNRWFDATSVYGYAGPVASEANPPLEFVTEFQVQLEKALIQEHVVALFSRLHPLIPQKSLLVGCGDYRLEGPTVSIDLSVSAEDQRGGYRKGHRYDLRKLREDGVTCVRDENGDYLETFIDIYYETMRRVNAADFYFFSRSYFESLFSLPELGFQLFVCCYNDEVICGSLFSLCDGIVQYHLSGTRASARSLAPIKLALDEARIWACRQQARVFHLGGGLGSKEDSLFRFKAGFSPRRHEFATWRWVILPEVYERLSQQRKRWIEQQQKAVSNIGLHFFPAYRSPVDSEG